jgi:hypothetical protein
MSYCIKNTLHSIHTCAGLRTSLLWKTTASPACAASWRACCRQRGASSSTTRMKITWVCFTVQSLNPVIRLLATHDSQPSWTQKALHSCKQAGLRSSQTRLLCHRLACFLCGRSRMSYNLSVQVNPKFVCFSRVGQRIS